MDNLEETIEKLNKLLVAGWVKSEYCAFPDTVHLSPCNYNYIIANIESIKKDIVGYDHYHKSEFEFISDPSLNDNTYVCYPSFKDRIQGDRKLTNEECIETCKVKINL
jgi:hypothetical protein